MTKPRSTESANRGYAVLAGFLGWTFDAFDFFVLTFVIDDVAKTFSRNRPEIALTIALSLAMRPVGAVIFGVMADRIGRRVPLVLNILFYAVISVLSGLAPNYRTFLILRMLFGVALGGQWGVGAALALESVSSKWRGVFSGLLQEGYTLGNLLAAVAFRTIYPHYGWRALFYLGGLPALLSLFIISKVKESPVWHEHRTNWKPYGRAALQHWRLFLYFVLLMAMVAFMAHGTQDMYPTFLRHGRNYSARTTADITIISMIGALLGGLFFGIFSDRLGRKSAMVTAALAGLVVVPLWIGAPNIALIVLGVFLMQFFVQGAAGVVPAHLNELTPGSLRGFFPGLAYQTGVLCASSITYFEAALGEHLSYAQAMGTLAAIVLFLGSLVFALGPENKGVSFTKVAH
jgi:SHS family lactate transporter-like MFS transporter